MARSKEKNTELNEGMESLLRVFIQKLTDKLNSVEVTAADFGVIRQFLKDNGYGVDPIKDADALDNLMEAFSKKKAGLPAIPTEKDNLYN